MINKAVHLFFPGPFGGAEQVILTGLERLKDIYPIELWIVQEQRVPQHAEYFTKEVKRLNIPYKTFTAKGIFDLNLIKEMKNCLDSSPILHAHGLKASFYSYLAKKQSPLIITHHGDTSHTFKVRLYELIQRFIMKRASSVIAVSNQMKSDLQIKNIKSEVIENLLSKEIEIIQDKENNNTQKFVVIGRLSPEKGINVLIRALSEVDDFKLVVIGLSLIHI